MNEAERDTVIDRWIDSAMDQAKSEDRRISIEMMVTDLESECDMLELDGVRW